MVNDNIDKLDESLEEEISLYQKKINALKVELERDKKLLNNSQNKLDQLLLINVLSNAQEILEVVEVTKVSVKNVSDTLWGFYIDSPVPCQKVTDDQIKFVGWVLSKESPAEAIELSYNDEAIATIPINQQRLDVAQAFSTIPLSANNCGFSQQISVASLPKSGSVNLKVICQDGKTVVLIGQVKCQKKISSVTNIVAGKTNLCNDYNSLGNHFLQKGNPNKAAECYQKGMYHFTLKHRPEFVKQYWDESEFLGPNFLILGASKCGTTSLHNYLVQHPNCLPIVNKEMYFFTSAGIPGIPVRPIEWYLSSFPPVPKKPKFVTGEASPLYLGADIEETVKSLFPNIKLIVILRNPVDRTISAYYHYVRQKREPRSLEELIASEMEQINKSTELELSYYGMKEDYLRGSLYVYSIKRWMNCFPKEQLLVLKSEEFFKNTQIVMNKVFDFLEISQYTFSKFYVQNKGIYTELDSQLEENAKQTLGKFFHPFNCMLEDYLEMTFDWN